MDWRLLRRDEARAHANPLGSQGKGSGHTATIADPTRRNNGNRQRTHGKRYQHQVRDIVPTRMSGTLEAVD